MLLESLLWSNIILCLVASGLILLFRRNRSSESVFIVFLLVFFSCLNYLDLRTINNPDNLYFLLRYKLLFEVAAVMACYFYTKTAFRDNSEIFRGPGFWFAITISVGIILTALLTPVEWLFFSPNFSEDGILYVTRQGFILYIFLFLLLVFGLVQLERTVTALHLLQRWGIKLEVLGVGLLMAAFAFYFSQCFINKTINMNSLTARSVVTLLAVGLILYSRFFRSKGSNLALSRGIVHRSFVLLIVGGYLILLGIIGEVLRYLEISAANDIFYVIIMLSSLGLAFVFLSERLRRKLTVLLHKNFYKDKYDYREQWESFSRQIINSASLSETQVAILKLLCTTFACKWASFYLQDEDSDNFTKTASFNVRLEKRTVMANSPLIDELQRKEWILNLTENKLNLEDTLVDNGFLIVPLFFDDELAGFIVLGEQINNGEALTYEDYDLLRMFAKQTITTVQGLRLADQLAVSRELAIMGKVSTFVLHDLKNQVSGLTLMLDNARNHISDPEFQEDMLKTVSNTVDNMTKLITRLKNLKEKPETVVSPVELSEVIQKAVESVGGNIQVTGDEVNIAVDRDEIYKVVLNLLVNALDATSSDDPPVKVVYGLRNGSAFIEVTDFGCGMSAEFIENELFAPFKTTKRHGFGIGLYQCKQVIEMHQGSISVKSKQGEGTTFLTLLPLATD